jgi:hypothetical protein
MKTIKEWFESAEEPLRSKLLKNLNPGQANNFVSSFHQAILCGFVWSHTPKDEGDVYWLRIFNEYADRARGNKKSAFDSLREDVLRLRTEVNCRIEHGADSGGHLEVVQSKLDEILNKHQ